MDWIVLDWIGFTFRMVVAWRLGMREREEEEVREGRGRNEREERKRKGTRIEQMYYSNKLTNLVHPFPPLSFELFCLVRSS